LSAWLELRRLGTIGAHRYVAVVFDDGWRDNYEHALAALMREEFPACIFLVVGAVNQNVRFWADVVADLYFSGQRRGTLAQLAALLPEPRVPRALLERKPDAEGLAQFIARLKAFPDATVEGVLRKLRSEPGISQPLRHADDREFLNWDEVGRMAASGLIEFGSHTLTHQRLDSIDEESVLRSEVVVSQDELKARLGPRFNSVFCYPNGSVGAQGSALVRQHYKAACTTRRGVNGRDADVYSLSRINVHRDIASTGSSLLARLY
jgi:peptidoglycan/xylan/chitin deacetylase (PgdA/CDA1 family)